MSQLTGQSIVACQLTPGTGTALHGVDAVTGDQLAPPYPSASAEQVEAAVTAASEVFVAFRDIDNKQRAEFLRTIATNIEGIIDSLVERVGQETALPEPRVRGEAGRTMGQLRLFADMVEEGSWVDARIDPAMPDREPMPRPDVRSMLRPLGPVAVFGASNFPLAFSVAGGDTASALAAGCPVVVKAHPAHPGTSELVGKAIADAATATGMPAGVFSLLFDAGLDVGQSLVEHPAIKAVGFTGSLKAGRALFQMAAARDEPIPVYAEMGSVNPQFLLPAALAARGESIAEGMFGSMTMGVGQFCTKPGVVLTNGDKAFRDKLIELVSGAGSSTMLTSGIVSAYVQGVERAADHPAVQFVAGKCDAESGVLPCLLETTLDAVTSDPSLLEECFGPAVLLVNYESTDELGPFIASLEGQLTATIHCDADDEALAAQLGSLLETRVGRMIYNQYPTGVEVNHAMVHGGPYPATTDSRTTSVGAAAILRFARPVCYQNVPNAALPAELQKSNPLGIRRMVDGQPE